MEILNNNIIIIIISIIWGFGISLLFRKICKSDKCTITKIHPDFLTNGSMIYDGKKNKCYELHKYYSECDY